MQSRMSVGTATDSRKGSSSSARGSHSHGSPLRPLSHDNTNQSPTDTSRSFAFPPPASSPRQGPAQRASLVIRQRRSSPLLHEIQGPSRRLSAHQMLLLTPFGGALPEAVQPAGPAGRMTRGSSSMGGPQAARSASFGMTSIPSSTGMGRDDPSAPRGLPTLSTRFNARHQSLVQSNPSPLSQPMATIQSTSDCGSGSDSSSMAVSRENSDTSGDDDEDADGRREAMARIEAARRVNAAAVAMMRSNSLPVLTQRELEALQDKDGELGIARGAHWAWVQDDADDIQMDSPVPRTTPPSRPFAFQDPFAHALGASPNSQAISPRYTAPATTSSDYHYSPTAEPRRMSEVNPSWPHNTSPGTQTAVQSRGTSVATITLSTSPSSPPQGEDTPSPPFPPTFNSRASMSALEQTPLLPLGALETLAPIRPRILRYKTSPARFTGLGLHLVVKSQPTSSEASTTGSVAPSSSSRRRSSGIDHDRRRSSGNSTSSNENRRTGTWAVVDVVDKLSASSNLPSISTTTSSSMTSLRTAESNRSSMPNPIYTIEHISARSGSMAVGGSDRFKSLPSRKGKPNSNPFAYESISPMGMGMFADPLAFPRRGSLAVLSQTPLGPWASPSVPTVGEEMLGAPKGNWQDRRGSWAEGWSNTPR